MLLRKLLLVVYLLITTTALLEVGVRLSGYSERHIYDPIYAPFDEAGGIPYVHRPNLRGARARGHAVIDTDSLGLRTREAGAHHGPRRADEFRIAVVGDSVTFGEGVPETGETYAQVLEDELNRRQGAFKVRVFNFGASAYSVSVMAATLRRRMMEVEPDLVLMAIIPADFNLDRTPSVDGHGYLTDKKLSGFLEKDSSLRPLLRRVHLLYLVRDVLTPRLDRNEKAQDILSAGGVPESYLYVREFKETAERHGRAHGVVLLPSLRSGFHNLPARLQSDGVTAFDLSALREGFTESEFRASRFDAHPSPAVHREIGVSLAGRILEGGWLKKAPQ